MIRILYVDDEPALLDLGKQFLEENGTMWVQTQSSALDALVELKTTEYDIIISDYQMPDLDGIAFLKEIRKNYGDLPFIIFTGRGREEIVIEAINEGADFYLQKGGKPTAQFAELAHKIKIAYERRQAATALRESEERFRALTQQSPDIITRFDREHRHLYVNSNDMHSLGLQPSEMVGKTHAELRYPKKFVHFVDDAIERVFTSHLPYRTEVMVPGHKVFDWLLFPEFGQDGEVTAVITSARDVTDQKTIEEDLQRSRDQVQNIANNLPGIIFQAVVDSDQKIRFTFISEGIKELTGLGTKLDGFYERFLAMIVPEDQRRFDTSIQSSILTRSRWNFEGRMICMSGELIWFDARSSPSIYNDEVFFNGVVFDITERKQTEQELLKKNEELAVSYAELAANEEELRATMQELAEQEQIIRESEAFSRSLVENLPDYILVYDMNGKILYVNPSAADKIGYPSDQILGTNIFMYISPSDHGLVKENSVRRASGEDIPTYELRVLAAEDQEVVTLVKAKMIQYHGQPAVLAVLTDISDMKRLIHENLRLASFTRLNPNPIIEFSLDKQVLYTNDATINTLKNIELSENPQLFFPPDLEMILEQVRRDLKKPVGFAREISISDANFGIWIYYAPEFSAFRLFAVDITRRVMAQSAQEQVVKKLNLLSSITRHDIRNSLHIITNYLDLSIEDPTDEERMGYLTHLRRAVDSISHQIEFTKDYQDLGFQAPIWQDVKEVCDLVVSTFNLKEIRWYSDTEGVEVYADPMLHKLFHNLIDNSLQHGIGITEIKLFHSVESDRLSLIYSDDGSGILPEMRDQLFTTPRHSMKRHGLFLVREILGITGMTIQETGTFGEGVRFEISVPKGVYQIRSP